MLTSLLRRLRGLARALKRHLSPAARAYTREKAKQDAAFDGAYGYDTGGTQFLTDLTIDSENAGSGGPHIASPPEEFAAALALVDLDLADLTFVDMGSGKGRAMLLAAERPFKRLIGIEFARETHEVALANFAKRAARQGPDLRIEVRNADATAFDYPDEPLLLFLYNPFDPPVMTLVAERAMAAWRAHPRPMRVLYMVPLHPDEWTRAGWRLIGSRGSSNLYAPPEE